MTFQRRIFLVIFMVGFTPALIILLISAALLNSTIDRVGAVGLENSLGAASIMTSDAEIALGEFLKKALGERIDWADHSKLREWMDVNRLDLAFRIEKGNAEVFFARSGGPIPADNFPSLKLASGVFHMELEKNSYICFAMGDSVTGMGCGVIMPAGYSERGRILSNALSAAASLGIYKGFSLKLLAVITILMIILVMIAGLMVSTVISRRLVKPLELLTLGAARIGRGDLDYRVKLSGGDEFSRLAGSFNDMAQSIKENQARLLDAERLAAWRDVARRIAHEIRNPLTPMTVELFRLKQRIGKDGGLAYEAMKSLESIDSQIRALQDLSGQFSLFAREPELKRIRCDIREIITDSAGLFRNYENVEIQIELPDNLPTLNIDPAMMGRLFGNLLKNSIEASPKGVNILLKAENLEDAVGVFIRDNGPGFPKEKLDKIDQPYITTKRSGTGLGMAIVKKIVEEHGGTIRFYNDGGAVAEIMLPFGS